MSNQTCGEPKAPYTCPKCGAKVSSETQPCTKCGCIGPMQHLEIRLTGKNAAGKMVTVSPPTTQHSDNRQKPKGGIGTSSQYKCPKCDIKVYGSSGKCPNRACGYSGTMKRKDSHK